MTTRRCLDVTAPGAPLSTVPTSRPSAPRSGEKGDRAQAIGCSRGGQTTKVHALTDVVGRPYALMLTPGNVADVRAAPDLLARMGRTRYVLADKGYDADALRLSLRQAGAVPVIPGRSNRKRAVRYDRALQRPPLDRERLLPPRGLPTRRHPLRQARRQLPVRRRARYRPRVPAVNESGA